MKKVFNNTIYYIILFLPLLDFITGICNWSNIGFSFSLVIKGLFLVLAIVYLLKNYKDKKIFILIFFYLITYFLYLILNQKNIIIEITNVIKIFYLPILILFFSNYQNNKITKKTLVKIEISYMLLYLIPIIFNLGHNLNELYPNKYMYLSYFYSGNELANTFIIMLPVTLIYLVKSNSYILKIFLGILILISGFLCGTKAYYLSIIIIIFYLIIINRKKVKEFFLKKPLIVWAFVASISLGILIYLPSSSLITNIKTTLNYYNVDEINDLFSLENIDHIIFSNRITFLKNINEEYLSNTTNLEKLLGMGREKILILKDIEIDIFDIFYSIGVVGTIIYLFTFIYILKNTKLKKIYHFTFYLVLIISLFSGHILFSPMPSTYLALLFLISKNAEDNKKTSILMISNMYPDKQNPHYGIFVKNVSNLLSENNFLVEKVVIYKNNNKYKKILSYIKFYLLSFLKSIFNNYDYIYVHFISHSTLGVIIPYLCSKNERLILNVHGNDIIADTEIDYKNERKSAIYLKYADIVVSPSVYFQKILMQKYHVPKEKIVIYPSGGVDHNKFKKIDKKNARKKANLKENITYFGYIARIEKDKGYDTLVLAINELKKQKKLDNIKFLIVGSGSEETKLNELIKKFKLENYIERRPIATQEELTYIYNSIEALIYPTRRKSESLGLTGLEAMACETIVIGSNKFGPSSYLEDKVNSITFSPENHKELTKKILEVLEMSSESKIKLKKEAKKTSLLYSKDKIKNVILNVFS